MSRSCFAIAAAGLLGLSVGCQAPGGKPASGGNLGPLLIGKQQQSKPDSNYIEIESVPRKDDIVQIVQFWNPVPWKYNAFNQPVGFQVPTYFISSETEKGAFVAGTVYAWLHTVGRDPTGQLVRKTVHMWQLGPEESFLFAVRKLAIGGYFYGFILTWPGSLDLSGQTVEIEFGYERGDGKLVMASPRMLRVPAQASSSPLSALPLTPPGDRQPAPQQPEPETPAGANAAPTSPTGTTSPTAPNASASPDSPSRN